MGQVNVKVNGRSVSRQVEDRTLLVEFLRDTLGLTGTHVGCDTAQCGACTVLMNGKAIKSCSIVAMQAEGADILTIEGVAKPSMVVISQPVACAASIVQDLLARPSR